MAHTLGPWERNGYLVFSRTEQVVVAEVLAPVRQATISPVRLSMEHDTPTFRQCAVNANLIAAAPDLLVACSEALEALQLIGKASPEDWPHNPDVVRHLMQAITAATRGK